MRNKPVKAITNFFPTDEVKNTDHFIRNQREGDYLLLRSPFRIAKIVSELQKEEKSLCSSYKVQIDYFLYKSINITRLTHAVLPTVDGEWGVVSCE